MSGSRQLSGPGGTQISCRGWQQEAALRMLMSNLGSGRATGRTRSASTRVIRLRRS
jgi:urocanate hydratase